MPLTHPLSASRPRISSPPVPVSGAAWATKSSAMIWLVNLLLDILGEAGDRPAPPQPLESQLAAWAQPHHPGIGPATALRAVLIWSRLHGIVSLEIAGNFASMGLDPGQLFEIQLATLTA